MVLPGDAPPPPNGFPGEVFPNAAPPKVAPPPKLAGAPNPLLGLLLNPPNDPKPVPPLLGGVPKLWNVLK